MEKEIARLEQIIDSLEKEAEDESDWMKYESIMAEVIVIKQELESYYEIWMREVE